MAHTKSQSGIQKCKHYAIYIHVLENRIATTTSKCNSVVLSVYKLKPCTIIRIRRKAKDYNCFLNKQTFCHNWGINIRLNGPMCWFKERTMFCYDLSQPATDNILPQRANVLPQCLYYFYEYILPAKKFEFFVCFSLLSKSFRNWTTTP